jgi:hypothetical protein
LLKSELVIVAWDIAFKLSTPSSSLSLEHYGTDPSLIQLGIYRAWFHSNRNVTASTPSKYVTALSGRNSYFANLKSDV